MELKVLREYKSTDIESFEESFMEEGLHPTYGVSYEILDEYEEMGYDIKKIFIAGKVEESKISSVNGISASGWVFPKYKAEDEVIILAERK